MNGDKQMIQKAAVFAAKAHDGMMRKGSKIPYIYHPMEVALIVAQMTDDPEVIAAAYLHDVLEDTSVTPEELERRCRSLGAELLPSNADFCARFDFAPRYPIWLKVWFSDEEFPASGRLLLDESAPHYLTIEDAVTVGSLILDQLTGAQHWAV